MVRAESWNQESEAVTDGLRSRDFPLAIDGASGWPGGCMDAIAAFMSPPDVRVGHFVVVMFTSRFAITYIDQGPLR